MRVRNVHACWERADRARLGVIYVPATSTAPMCVPDRGMHTVMRTQAAYRRCADRRLANARLAAWRRRPERRP
jgi:hypothetical protein